MPLGGAVIMGSVALVTGIAGVVQQNAAAKMQKSVAEKQIGAQEKIATQTNAANVTIAQGHDIASIINTAMESQSTENVAAISSSIEAQGLAKAASLKQQGNILVMTAIGLTVITLGVIVVRASKN